MTGTDTATSLSAELAFFERSFRAIGTVATVVVADSAKVEMAESILRREIEAIDLACSRFRPDSDLERLHRQSGAVVEVSPLLFEALDVAVAVARRTAGAVDPTVGNAMSALGYDCDFDQIGDVPPPPPEALGAVVGFAHIHLDPLTGTVRIPRGVRLDLGSSAKALVADRAAARIAAQLDTGVLVNVGGDVAVAGSAPTGGWPIGIAVDSSTPGSDVDQVVAIHHGGLASSSTAVRTWMVGREKVHHIVDPSTGYSSTPYWTLVSAAGASCVDANAVTTAAVVWGERALERLHSFGQAVRLVRHDGQVATLGGWPEVGAS
jgi:FAD:protein FMN transferase